MQTFKNLYQMDFILDRNEYSTVKELKNPTFMNTLPVLASQFFKTKYFQTLKTPFFTTVDLILIVKSTIIIIALKTD